MGGISKILQNTYNLLRGKRINQELSNRGLLFVHSVKLSLPVRTSSRKSCMKSFVNDRRKIETMAAVRKTVWVGVCEVIVINVMTFVCCVMHTPLNPPFLFGTSVVYFNLVLSSYVIPNCMVRYFYLNFGKGTYIHKCWRSYVDLKFYEYLSDYVRYRGRVVNNRDNMRCS